MYKISSETQRPFNTHKSVNKFFFTQDGLPFFKENDANAHAAALNKNNKAKYPGTAVTKVTRDEVNAWAADVAKNAGTAAVNDAQGQLDAAKVSLTEAEAALTTAQEAQNTVNGNTASTPAQKTAATKAVTKATAGVATATQAVADAQAVVDELAKA